MVIESLQLLLTRNINDRFNTKYSQDEIEIALKRKNLEIQETVRRM
jgi:hypothetical protein